MKCIFSVSSSWGRMEVTDWVLSFLRILKESGFQFIWVGLPEVAYVSSGLSSFRVFDHLCIIYVLAPYLKISAFLSLESESEMLILGKWIFTEPMSTILGVGCYWRCQVEKNRTFTACSIDKACILHRLIPVESWNNNLINFVSRYRSCLLVSTKCFSSAQLFTELPLCAMYFAI